MSQFRVPRNREQAYGYSIAAAMDAVEAAYQEASLKRGSMLCQSTAESLECAITTLRHLFPNLDPVDVYARSEKLIQQLSFLYRSLLQNEDSTMRKHMLGLVKARLYASKVSPRLGDLTSDSALVSISQSDPLPLALVLGEQRNQIVLSNPPGGGQLVTYVQGITPEIASGLMESGGRPYKEMEKVNINRRALLGELNAIADVIGPLVARAPWKKVVNLNSCAVDYLAPAGYVVGTPTASHIDEIGTRQGIVNFHNDLVTTGGALAALGNGAIWASGGVDNSGTKAGVLVKTRGAAVAAPPCQTLVTFSAESGEEVHGTRFTYEPNQAIRATNLTVYNGGVPAVPTLLAIDGAVTQPPINIGGGEFTYSYVSFGQGFNVIVWTFRAFESARYVLKFEMTGVLATGAQITEAVTASPVMAVGNQVTIDDTERLEQIKDIDMTDIMTRFFLIRAELVDDGVKEEWYLQSYHSYLFGVDRTYTPGAPLNNNKITAVKTRMLMSETWAYFKDLSGFLNKLYDDLGSLMALAQTTDFE